MFDHLIDVIANRLKQLLELINGGTVVDDVPLGLCVLDGG